MSKQKKQASPWTSLLLGLVLLVSILLITALILGRDRGRSEESTSTPSDSNQLSQSPGISEEGSESSRETEQSISGTEDSIESNGLSFEDAISLDIMAMAKQTLPEPYERDGFQLLHQLADGRLILQHPQRISIYDLDSEEELIVAEADFGLQGTANDRFIVYGEGGDEVFRLDVYTIANGARSTILEDPNGYFGFEIDEESHFYTSKVEALKYGKQMAGWIEYDLVSGSATTHDGTVRSLGNWDLKQMDPNISLDWVYEVGQRWYEAWRVDQDNSFAIGIEYLDIYQDLYRYSLYRINGQLEAVVEDLESGRPVIHTADNLFVFNRAYFYYPENQRWYHLDSTGAENSSLAALAISADGQELLLANQEGGRFFELFRLPLQ